MPAYWSEILLGLIAAATSFWLLPMPAGAFAAALALLVITVAVVDIERLIIPDTANLAIFGLGLVLAGVEALPGETLVALGDALLRGLAAGAAIQLLRLGYRRAAGREGLGFGDVKLATAGATWLAWRMLPVALELAALGAILAIGARVLIRREWPGRHDALPFGAFLAPAIWAAFLAERLFFLE